VLHAVPAPTPGLVRRAGRNSSPSSPLPPRGVQPFPRKGAPRPGFPAPPPANTNLFSRHAPSFNTFSSAFGCLTLAPVHRIFRGTAFPRLQDHFFSSPFHAPARFFWPFSGWKANAPVARAPTPLESPAVLLVQTGPATPPSRSVPRCLETFLIWGKPKRKNRAQFASGKNPQLIWQIRGETTGSIRVPNLVDPPTDFRPPRPWDFFISLLSRSCRFHPVAPVDPAHIVV